MSNNKSGRKLALNNLPQAITELSADEAKSVAGGVAILGVPIPENHAYPTPLPHLNSTAAQLPASNPALSGPKNNPNA